MLSLIVMAFCTFRLREFAALPIAPHLIPLGPPRLPAQVYSAVWWVALASSASAAVSLLLALLARIEGNKRHRALRFVSDTLGIVLYGIAAVAIASFVFELPVSTVFATSSIFAVVLGFALQNTVADLLSGLALNIEQPFRVGDHIAVAGGVSGKVTEMNWRATRILSVTGDLHVVPNGVLSHGTITNHDSTLAAHHRSYAFVKVGVDESPGRVLPILRAAMMAVPKVLDAPAPDVEVLSFGDWAIEYRLIFYYATWVDETEVLSGIYDAVWTHLKWAGIALPTPRTLMTRPNEKAAAPTPLAAMLAEIDMFEHLRDDERDRLAQVLDVRHVEQGEQLVAAGDDHRALFLVRQGLVALKADDTGGDATRLRPGEYFGESALLTGAPHLADVTAVTDASIYQIDKSHLQDLVRERPEIAERFASTLSARLAKSSHGAVVHDESGLHRLTSEIHAFFHHDHHDTRERAAT